MLLIASSIGAVAQPPSAAPPADAIEKAVVTQLLATNDPRQLAWGAYLAGNYQQKSAIPAIILLLRFANADVQLAAIDALIRLDADVSEEDLSAFLKTNQVDPVLVLLARDPKKHGDFLMRMLDRQLDDTDWVAVNSILSMAPPPGFAARLLREWTLHFHIQVWDNFGSGSDGGCGWVEDGVSGGRPGYPPMFSDIIQESLSSGDTVLATGPHPVSYRRKDSASRHGLCISKDPYRRDYLTYLAGFNRYDKEVQALNSGASVRWVDVAKYQADAEAVLNTIRAAVSYLRKGLIEHGLLTAEESAGEPKLEVVVTDLRQNHHEPLPVIDWRLDK
jgi:hypothetical protein